MAARAAEVVARQLIAEFPSFKGIWSLPYQVDEIGNELNLRFNGANFIGLTWWEFRYRGSIRVTIGIANLMMLPRWSGYNSPGPCKRAVVGFKVQIADQAVIDLDAQGLFRRVAGIWDGKSIPTVVDPVLFKGNVYVVPSWAYGPRVRLDTEDELDLMKEICGVEAFPFDRLSAESLWEAARQARERCVERRAEWEAAETARRARGWGADVAFEEEE